MSYRNLSFVCCVINIPTVLFFFFYSFFLSKKPISIFFPIMLHGKDQTEVQKAQIESLHAAGKSYIFMANHLHRPKGCSKDFVTKRL